ncbi:hypothetical protein PZA11_005212 [Diplocarpon coronariae]
MTNHILEFHLFSGSSVCDSAFVCQKSNFSREMSCYTLSSTPHPASTSVLQVS